MPPLTKSQTLDSLRDCVETVYVISCSRCDVKLEHSFAVAPKGKGDLTYVAEMAYDDGWLGAGGKFQSTGEQNGEFTIYAICPSCAKPTENNALSKQNLQS